MEDFRVPDCPDLGPGEELEALRTVLATAGRDTVLPVLAVNRAFADNAFSPLGAGQEGLETLVDPDVVMYRCVRLTPIAVATQIRETRFDGTTRKTTHSSKLVISKQEVSQTCEDTFLLQETGCYVFEASRRSQRSRHFLYGQE